MLRTHCFLTRKYDEIYSYIYVVRPVSKDWQNICSDTEMQTNACIWEASSNETIILMEVTHCTAKVVFQHKVFICGNDTLFSDTYKA